MNKSEMIEELAVQANLNYNVAETIVNLVVDSMKTALIEDERIELRGFGSFHIEHYQAYTGRNPKTGDSIEVPPKKLPFFKVGKELKEKINKKFLAKP
ncbi:MAG: integration host factor subunit beta [Deltaproteobacteria bacterium]|nr:integration host factor subunit beta [Candidatus Anaeroferrophillus wilburensis]MBN2888267.1 integration host factor subunit beta [Deltaproteobacteria bacterium]